MRLERARIHVVADAIDPTVGVDVDVLREIGQEAVMAAGGALLSADRQLLSELVWLPPADRDAQPLSAQDDHRPAERKELTLTFRARSRTGITCPGRARMRRLR